MRDALLWIHIVEAVALLRERDQEKCGTLLQNVYRRAKMLNSPRHPAASVLGNFHETT
jgi:hypothetical protein